MPARRLVEEANQDDEPGEIHWRRGCPLREPGQVEVAARGEPTDAVSAAMVPSFRRTKNGRKMHLTPSARPEAVT